MAGAHPRNFGPMLVSPRCGAKTRAGKGCLAPVANGKGRCRMHGGAKGSGAPRGNTNALKEGLFTKAAIEEMRLMRRLMRESIGFLDQTDF
jgi:uncharacterized protein YjcR